MTKAKVRTDLKGKKKSAGTNVSATMAKAVTKRRKPVGR